MKPLVLPGHSNVTPGFAPPRRAGRAVIRRTHMMVHVFAAIGLIVSLAVAATAVSIGIARAQTAPHISVTVLP